MPPTVPPASGVDVEPLRKRLVAAGQEYLLKGWTELDAEAQARFAAQLAALDLPLLQRLYHEMTTGAADPGKLDTTKRHPPAVLPLPQSFEDWEHQQKAAEVGEAELAAGR